MGDIDALDEHIARLRKLPDLSKIAAPTVARVVEAELERQIAAGTDPQGKAWEPRQEGGKALATGAAALTVYPMGTKVVCKLKGHVARHDLGTAKGGLVRQILPTKGLPPRLARAVKEATFEVFDAVMGGDTNG